MLPDHQPEGNIRKTLQLTLWLGGMAFLAALVVLAVSGWFARYLQDDYCFDFLLKHNGFWNAQVFTFFNEVTFNGNRFSTNLFMGLLAQIGPLSARLLPVLLLAAWLAGSYWLLQGLNWLFQWRWSPAFLFFTALSIELFTLLQAPNLYQVVFWRPASVTYLMPLVLMTLLFAYMVHQIMNENSSPISTLLCSLMAFWVAGHSETAAVFLFGFLAIIFVWLKFSQPLQGLPGQVSSRLVSAAFIGTLLSILVLVLSPSARLRQAALFPQPPQLSAMLRFSIDGIRQFLLVALYRQTLPTALIFLVFFFAGFLLSHFSPKTMGLRKPSLMFPLIFILFAFFFLLLCVTLPSAYASSSVPEERVLLWSGLTLVAASIALSIVLGDWMGRFILGSVRRRRLVALGFAFTVILLLLILLVPAQVRFQPAYPEIRDWLGQDPLRLAVLIILFLFIFWMIGRVRLEKRFIEEWIPALLLMLVFSTCLASIPQLFDSMPAYQLRAELWDWRDAQIQAAIRRGNYEIEIPALDSIAGVTELQADPGHWVNNCAELYYGMKSISAVPPVLTSVPGDEPTQ